MSLGLRSPAALLTALLVAAVAAVPAPAAFPGANGPLVMELDGDGACFYEGGRYLAATPWNRVELTPITPPCEQTPDESANEDKDDHESVTRSVSSPEFAPDGERLLAYQSGAQPSGLVTLAPDGSDLRPVPVAVASTPSFAPDGRRFAFSRDDGIWTARTDGTDVRRILRRPRCGSNCVRVQAPRWSPDGRYLSVEVEQFRFGPGKPPKPRPGIWLVRPADGRLVRRVAKRGGDVDWSPDSRRLVYATDYQQRELKGGASGGNLYVVRPDGRGRRRIVHRRGTAETTPVWSPDGRWIAWVSIDFGRGDVGFEVWPSLWRIGVPGGRAAGSAKRLGKLPEPYEEEAFFSPPGSLTWRPLPR